MIKDRIVQILELKGIAKEDFFARIGVTSANFRGKAKETPLNSTAIEKIFAEIPDINLAWLITGNGAMLITNTGNGKMPKTAHGKPADPIIGDITTFMDAYNKIVDAIHGISRSNELLAQSNCQMSENNSKLLDTNAKLLENMTVVMNGLKDLKTDRRNFEYGLPESKTLVASDVKGEYHTKK